MEGKGSEDKSANLHEPDVLGVCAQRYQISNNLNQNPSGKCESWQPDRPVHRVGNLYDHPAQLQPLEDKTNYMNNLMELNSVGNLSMHNS